MQIKSVDIRAPLATRIKSTEGRIEIVGSKEEVLRQAAAYEAQYPAIAYGTERTDTELEDGAYRSTIRYYSAD